MSTAWLDPDTGRNEPQRDTVDALRAGTRQYRMAAWSVRLALFLGLMASLFTTSAWQSEHWLLAAKHAGPRAYALAQALSGQIEQAAALDEVARLKQINLFFDRNIRFAEDIDTWGVDDYWASPLELLSKGQGDCEDYAIGKYFALIAAGVPSNKLRLVYVRAQFGGPGGPVQAHMVLAYYAYPTAEPLILDNLIVDILPAAKRPDLTPVFSFNAEGLWQGASGAAAGDPVARLSRWRDVLRKAHEEGWW